MEKRGANVVAIDIPSDHQFDIIPWNSSTEMWQKGTEMAWSLTTNSWWFAHEAFKSQAKICYIAANDLTKINIGSFDTALMANMLLHNRDPLQIISNAVSKSVSEIIIVELFHHDLENCKLPIIQLNPDPSLDNVSSNWNVWWRFTTTYFINYLKIMGFTEFKINRYTVPWNNLQIEEFTLSAKR